jgi:hypothetical protein
VGAASYTVCYGCLVMSMVCARCWLLLLLLLFV